MARIKGTAADEWSFDKLGIELLTVCLIFPIVMSVVTPVSADHAADTGWGPRILITDDNANYTGASQDPSVAFDMFGNLYVAWDDGSELYGSGSDVDLFFRKWNATTRTWGSGILITDDNLNNTESSADSQIETDAFGNLHIVWHDDSDLTGKGFGGILWRMWNAGAESWGPTVQVGYEANDTGPVGAYPRLVADDFGNVHLTFRRGCPFAPCGIQYMKWNGTAKTWSAKTTVSGNSTEFGDSRIAVDPSRNVHVIWDDYSNISGASAYGKDKDIFYRKLNASTNSWDPIFHLNDDDQTDVYRTESGDIVADIFGNVYVVWSERMDQAGLGYGVDNDIFYRKWNVSSGLWEPRAVVSSDPADTGGSKYPDISADGQGNLHVVWWDYSDVDGAGLKAPDIFYRKWDAVNCSWENTTPLTNDLNDQLWASFPDVASDRHGNVAVVWYDGSGLNGSGPDYDIYMRRLEVPMEAPKATMDCDPDTLNLKSQGRWMTCYIELPSGYDPRDIDAGTILLNDVLAPELDPRYGFVRSETSYITDHDGDGVLERMVKFDRPAVQSMLSPGDSVMHTITGKMFDGTEFEGTDEVRVIDSVHSTQSIRERTPRQGRSESAVEFLIRMRTLRSIANLI